MAAETVSFTSPLRQTMRSCKGVRKEEEIWEEAYLEEFGEDVS